MCACAEHFYLQVKVHVLSLANIIRLNNLQIFAHKYKFSMTGTHIFKAHASASFQYVQNKLQGFDRANKKVTNIWSESVSQSWLALTVIRELCNKQILNNPMIIFSCPA